MSDIDRTGMKATIHEESSSLICHLQVAIRLTSNDETKLVLGGAIDGVATLRDALLSYFKPIKKSEDS